MIIAIEGQDACGKQTHSKMVAAALRGTRFSFPNYESDTGKAILGHLRREWMASFMVKAGATEAEARAVIETSKERHTLLNAMTFQSLQTANRLELLPQIRRAQQDGPVVFDRYWQSAVVYGGLEGLDPAWLRYVQEHPMPPADVNILLDVSVEEGFKRRPERRDRYEDDRPFLEKVRVAYLRLWEQDLMPWMNVGWEKPLTSKKGWWVVNGIGAINDVHERIMECVARTQTGAI